MPATGKGEKRILVIAEAPGKTEDERNVQLVGQAGQILRLALQDQGIDLDQDCWKTNAIRCRPPSNRTPTSREINLCHPLLWQDIERFKPKLILLPGNIAVQSFLLHRWKKDLGGIYRWRGWVIPDQDVGCWVAPIFHPSYVLRSQGMPTIENTFTADINRALAHLQKPFPSRIKNEVDILMNPMEAMDRIRDIIKHPPRFVAIDYETTGLKCQAKNHSIISVALAPVGGPAFAFPMSQPAIETQLTQLLRSKVPLVAQNAAYEEAWSRGMLYNGINELAWDTALAAHVLDSRPGISGLKFQTYVNFGVPDYDSEIASFLQTDEEERSKRGANGFNSIGQLWKESPEKLLRYNGLDALFTKKLALKQIDLLAQDRDLRRGYVLLHRGISAMVDLHQQGFHLNKGYCERQDAKLTERIEEDLTRIHADRDIRRFKKARGQEFNPNSDPQLREFLYKHMKGKTDLLTKAGNNSASEEALIKLVDKAPVLTDILALRKHQKTRDTYLRAYMREAVDGVVHPFFHLGQVRTYRSSSSDPNLQNVPKRDPKVQKLVRRAIIPRPGYQIMEVDYKSIEVCVSACYHKDPRMIKYIEDPSKDMHRDMAMELFLLKQDQVSKEARHVAKNGFVFPEFYGSYYEDVAPGLWDALEKDKVKVKGIDTSARAWLRDAGIGSLERFKEHVQAVEKDFWRKRFKVYDEWKREAVKEYERKGYLQMLTGFKCSGPLKRNEIVNYPIQGTAFHCLLWSLTRLCRIAKKENWKSRWIGQVHDSAICDLAPDEKDHVIRTVKQVMTKDIREKWPWIIVPLTIEIELAPVDKPWSETKEEHKP
jgi:uracil-DNA glycosylase family 4